MCIRDSALKRVAALLPAKRQSLFFSATMPASIAALGRQFISDPVRVEVTPQASTAERVVQMATFVNQAEKQALLTLSLRAGLADGSLDRALVFTRTKHGADRVVRHLAGAGIQVAAIHGNKSQPQRTAAINGFRSGHIRVLVATDIAARGIDIPGVSHVFNYEIPNVPEQYVHRIGRTARAGADGLAMSYVAPDEKPYLRDIEKLTGIKLAVQPLPADFAKAAAGLPAPSRRSGDEDAGNRRMPGGRGDGHRARGPAGPRSDDRSQPRRSREDGDRRPARPAGDRPERTADPRKAAAGNGRRDWHGAPRSGQAGDGNARPAQDRSGQDRSAQNRAGPNRTGQNRAGDRRTHSHNAAR